MAAPVEYEVIAAAAVVRLEGGSERYLYRGQIFPGKAVTSESIKHLLAVGLIKKVTAKANSGADQAPKGKVETAETGEEETTKTVETEGTEKTAASGNGK